jgi:hypothetical protein
VWHRLRAFANRPSAEAPTWLLDDRFQLGEHRLGAVVAAYDEAMHSTAYNTFAEVQAQEDRKYPVPTR